MKFVSKLRQRGVTLFELLLVLFVAAFVAVAVATIYNKVNTTYKTNALFNDTNTMAANIRSLFGGSGGKYSALSPADAITAGIVPEGMHTGSNATHQFSSTNGAWSIGIASAGAEFVITLSALPQNVCVDIASKALGVAKSVDANGSAVAAVASAITGCNNASSNVVAMTFN
jgi:hypothetical protein